MSNTARWTLDELSERAHTALALRPSTQASARVRAVPDRRTIRYYTTLGLLDRPAEMRGRTALYAERHLLQLLAIKRLQADGLSLAAVQERLGGLDDGGLRRVADLPAPSEALSAPGAPSSASEAPEADADDLASTTAPEREAFWAAAPAPLDDSPSDEVDHADRTPLRTLTGVELAPGATLLLEGLALLNGQLTPDDLEALRGAAAPLVQILRERGILRDLPGRSPL